jgi:hypothetical protein
VTVVVAVTVGGGGFAVITAVGTDVAVVEPSPLLATTRKRSVFPTSADVSVYVSEWAPLMFAQLPPVLSHRLQK